MRKKTKKKGGNLSQSELNKVKHLIKDKPSLGFLFNDILEINNSNSNSDLNVNNSNNNIDNDSIKIMIQSVKDYNNNPKMTCNQIIAFLKNYEESKKLFNDITINELDHIILATEHVCDSNQ